MRLDFWHLKADQFSIQIVSWLFDHLPVLHMNQAGVF